MLKTGWYKIAYLYFLTPRGIKEKTTITYRFETFEKVKILLAIIFGENFQENRNHQSRKFDNDWQFLATP